jgi:hypothetical protein
MTVLSRAGQKSGRPAEKCRSGPKEQQIIDLEQEFKQVHEAAAAEKKRLEDELAEEKRKAKEATAQFKTVSIGRSNLCVGSPCSSSKKVFLWYANCDVS